jgi:hypothetical protein
MDGVGESAPADDVCRSTSRFDLTGAASDSAPHPGSHSGLSDDRR